MGISTFKKDSFDNSTELGEGNKVNQVDFNQKVEELQKGINGLLTPNSGDDPDMEAMRTLSNSLIENVSILNEDLKQTLLDSINKLLSNHEARRKLDSDQINSLTALYTILSGNKKKSDDTEGRGVGTEKLYGKKPEGIIDVNPEILKKEMGKNLKTISLMNLEEIRKELGLYGVEIPDECKNNINKLKKLLNDARNTIAIEDINSDIIDGHIGSFVQGESKYCSVLFLLDTMTDDEIKDMIQKNDSDNSYYVTFPQDKGNNNAKIKITEEELNLGSLTINENGQNRILDDLPKGDKDVTLITMAFIKRFGTNIVDNGDWAYKTQNKFRTQTEPKLKDNQYFEDIQNYSNLPSHTTIGFLNPDEIKRKGIDFGPQTNEEVSWIENKRVKREASEGAAIMTLSNGKKACITKDSLYISDGTLIPNGHAMSFRGYDEKSKELIVSGSEFNNVSEVRIPKELFIFIETASLEGTPGVDKTSEPTE